MQFYSNFQPGSDPWGFRKSNLKRRRFSYVFRWPQGHTLDRQRSPGCSPALTGSCGFVGHGVESREFFKGKLFGGGMKVNANCYGKNLRVPFPMNTALFGLVSIMTPVLTSRCP